MNSQLTENKMIKLVVFSVADILCGLRIDHVQEIKRVSHIAKVHRAPDYIRGVINLRGQIVTIIDLRKKFNYEIQEINNTMRIVIVKRNDETIGLLVDTIEDAIVASTTDIQSPPANIHGAEGRFFTGVINLEKCLIAMIDTNLILEKETVLDRSN